MEKCLHCFQHYEYALVSRGKFDILDNRKILIKYLIDENQAFHPLFTSNNYKLVWMWLFYLTIFLVGHAFSFTSFYGNDVPSKLWKYAISLLIANFIILKWRCTKIDGIGCNKSHLMVLNGIGFLLTMLIMLLMTLAVDKHQFILVYQQCGEVWLGVRLDINFAAKVKLNGIFSV